ncbi:putative myo-inositol transporter [Mycosarcoma maydis]|uniref:Myo-inositol transporter n=1 Tax=Mycosarcoma maydis TaxID=5270 RepID=A0A0D1DUB9_MYCMD|nr:putative myo-inositol transporter [Ustilago maydis 521]KIS67376.1 putative myo-inositol transporter [Ustilago maydis 521]|eukprot:XP_011391149.1 putative myo-inositol transporter [Ustilago maydis 521]
MADRDPSLTPDEDKPHSLQSDDKFSPKASNDHAQLHQLHLATRSVVSTEGIIDAAELDQVLDEAAIEAAGQGESNSLYLWTLTFFATIGGLLFGYDTGAISSVLVQVGTDLDNKELTDGNKEFITSALTVGAIISALCAGVVADKFGRKWTLVICDIMFIVGAVIQAAAHKKWDVVGGRFVLGLGIGAAAQIVPVYIQELAPARARGRLTCLNSIAVTFGQVVATAIGAGFEHVSSGWRWIIALGAFPPIIQLIGIHFFMSESPRYLVKQRREDEAARALTRIYPLATPEQINAKLGVLKKHIQTEDAPLRYRIVKVWTDVPTRRAVFLTSMVLASQQLSGFNSLMYFSGTLFKSAGLKQPIATSLIVSGANFLCTFIPLKYIDRFGRRRFLLATMPCVIIFLVCTAGIFAKMLQPTNQRLVEGYPYPTSYTSAMLVFMVLYVCSYATGLGNVPWQQGEFFSTETRMIGTSISTAVNWAANLVISSTFLSLMNAITPSGAFGFYAGLTFVFLLIVYFLYPETSLLSLEEVRTTLNGGFNVKKSLKVRKEKIALWNTQKQAAKAETAA